MAEKKTVKSKPAPKKPAKARAGRKRSTATRLTAKESAFIEHYLVQMNAAHAARLAGYSTKSAGRIGHELLQKPHIGKVIAAARKERSKRLRADADWVLERLVEEAKADLLDIFDDNGCFKPLKEWPPIWRQALVTSLENRELTEEDEDGARVAIGSLVVVKFSDKLRRVEMIGKHIDVSAFRERVTHDVDEESPLAKLMKQIGGRGITPKEPKPAALPAPTGIKPKE